MKKPIRPTLFLAAAIAALALPAHATIIDLAIWDIPAQVAAPGTKSTAAPTVLSGFTATPIDVLGESATLLNPIGISAEWRWGRWSSNTDAYFGFSITADVGSTLVISELLLSARVTTSTSASWTNPLLNLSYSTTADFSEDVTQAGALAFANIGASATGDAFDSTSGTFFTTPLTIESGETYFFKLIPSGYSGANARLHLLSNPDDSGDDFIIRGTLSVIPEPSAFAALAGLGALGVAALRRRRA